MAAEMGLSIDAPAIVDPDRHAWDWEADLVIVGFGGAGIAAAVEALEAGLSVIAVDRFEGGGSTAVNGGVFYAGGGTSVQIEAGESDDPQAMLDYLRIEAGEVVADETLRRFVAESPQTIDWLRRHGAPFEGSVWRAKCSYPPLDHFLYHSDNSLVADYVARAKPAARGHRVYKTNGGKAWGLGAGITDPLTRAALDAGLQLHRFAEAHQLVRDAAGQVVGVNVHAMPAGDDALPRLVHHCRRAEAWLATLPPSLPFASLTMARSRHHQRKAAAIEARRRVPRSIRARYGVLLSTGGFVTNSRMLARFAPKYRDAMPNATLGEQGAGILLGMSAGGATALMDRVSGWRFINPPKAWSDAIVVNRAGRRFVDETVYGATLGEHIVERQDGRAWLIYDRTARRQAFAQARDPHIVPFQRDVTLLNLVMNYRKATSLAALGRSVGIDSAELERTVATYNRAIADDAADAFGKKRADRQPIVTPPFYAMDISVDSRFLPLPIITVGGLQVDEGTGQVRDDAGERIDGLYAAGRTAIGIASQTYVSGLSFADCVFSGRRVARAIAVLKARDGAIVQSP
jgi:3-oxo-5alpha-steroid 4-dehydrogenase